MTNVNKHKFSCAAKQSKPNQTEWTTGPGGDNRKPQRWLPHRDALRQSKMYEMACRTDRERARGKSRPCSERNRLPRATIRLLFVPLSVARVALGWLIRKAASSFVYANCNNNSIKCCVCVARGGEEEDTADSRRALHKLSVKCPIWLPWCGQLAHWPIAWPLVTAKHMHNHCTHTHIRIYTLTHTLESRFYWCPVALWRTIVEMSSTSFNCKWNYALLAHFMLTANECVCECVCVRCVRSTTRRHSEQYTRHIDWHPSAVHIHIYLSIYPSRTGARHGKPEGQTGGDRVRGA